MWYPIVMTVIVSYLLGNLNGAVLISALMHDDVRSHGSGNAGLTNFVRNYGAGRALYVVLIDAGKAVLSCLVCGLLLEPYDMGAAGAALGGLAAMLGHVFPALLGFKGGKGILSGFFVAAVLDWRIALLILAVFAIAYAATKFVSLGSVLGAAAFGIAFVVLHHDDVIVMVSGIVMALLTIYMHRENIARLLKGQERKTNLFSKGKK